MNNRSLARYAPLPRAASSWTPQARSDLARLYLLSTHGGVWADATLLCMEPLDAWMAAALAPSDMWMYHGPGGGRAKGSPPTQPASWFVASKPNSRILRTWWEAASRLLRPPSRSPKNYFWMDQLFAEISRRDPAFHASWRNVPFISCNAAGSAHMIAGKKTTRLIGPPVAHALAARVPHVLKLDKRVQPPPRTLASGEGLPEEWLPASVLPLFERRSGGGWHLAAASVVSGKRGVAGLDRSSAPAGLAAEGQQASPSERVGFGLQNAHFAIFRSLGYV